MRTMISSLALAGLLLGSAAQAAPKTPQERLAKTLSGRVAGKPVDCIYLHDIRSSQIIDKTAILYETNGGTYYLNTPRSGASSLNWNDVLVTDTHSSQLCSIDVVHLYDNGSRMWSGFVGLGDFVPYTKPRPATD